MTRSRKNAEKVARWLAVGHGGRALVDRPLARVLVVAGVVDPRHLRVR